MEPEAMTQNPTRSVALHIGAHKTATTHLQRSLGMQQQAMINNGIRYYGPENLRRPQRGLGDIFALDVYDSPPRPRRSRSEQTEFMFKDGHRVIFSDENFIGVLHDKSGQILSPMYPQAARRVAALSEAMECGSIEVFVGVRNATSFLTSAYSQALLGGRHITFKEYAAVNPLDNMYWAGLVARLRAAAGVGHVTVWLQEDYHRMFHVITRAMLGPDTDMRVAPLDQPVHVGLSEAAVAYTLAYDGPDPLGDVAAQSRVLFPIGPNNPPFDPFDEKQKTAAWADYERQLTQIAQIEGVTLLRP